MWFRSCALNLSDPALRIPLYEVDLLLGFRRVNVLG